MICPDSVCILSNDYPSAERPVYVFVEQLVCALIDYGVQVNVIAPQSLTKCLIRGVPILPPKILYSTLSGKRYYVYRPYILSFGNRLKWVYKIVERFNQRKIKLCIDKIAPRILYGHFWHCGNILKGYALQKNLPLFVACGEGDDALEMLVNSLSSKEKKKLVLAVRGVISVSTENKRKCIDYGLALERNIVVLPNAVNNHLFSVKGKNSSLRKVMGIAEEDFVILFVGGFTPRKGSGILAKAIDSINDSRVKVMFVGAIMPGDEDDPHCQGIVYKGKVPHDKLPDYYASADVFVLPTQKEGCSNAIVEALAMGLPVISSTGAFNDDILNENNSIRINPADVDELANAITRLRDNVGLRKKLAAGALESAKSLTIGKRAENIMMFISQQLTKC